MNINISIDGVLRNTIQKLEYHYDTYCVEKDDEEPYETIEIDENGEIIPNDENNLLNFEYKINYPIKNDNLKEHFIFQNDDEFNHFLYIEFPIEIFGHASLSHPNVIIDLNKLIYEYPEHDFSVIGLNEMGKSKPSTLFFLSKNGFLGNNIKFIKSENIENEWEKCDIWITDNRQIIEKCPINKKVIKFNTQYNGHFTITNEINKLTEIIELWSKFSENITT